MIFLHSKLILAPLAPDPFGSARWIKNQRIPHPPDFHERLVRAIMTRDPAVADREMHAHLHFAKDLIQAPSEPGRLSLGQPGLRGQPS